MFYIQFQDNFDPPGSEFISCELADWRPYPNFLEKISDANYKQWAVDLHGLWKENCRQMIDDVGVGRSEMHRNSQAF